MPLCYHLTAIVTGKLAHRLHAGRGMGDRVDLESHLRNTLHGPGDEHGLRVPRDVGLASVYAIHMCI